MTHVIVPKHAEPVCTETAVLPIQWDVRPESAEELLQETL